MDPLPMENFRHLFSFSKNQNISLQRIAQIVVEDLYEHFHLPLSIIANQELNEILTIIQGLNTTQDYKDTWTIEGRNTYSVKRTYLALSVFEDVPGPFKWIWKSRALPKQQFLFCLLLMDKLNTRDLLTTKNFHIEYTSWCPLPTTY